MKRQRTPPPGGGGRRCRPGQPPPYRPCDSTTLPSRAGGTTPYRADPTTGQSPVQKWTTSRSLTDKRDTPAAVSPAVCVDDPRWTAHRRWKFCLGESVILGMMRILLLLSHTGSLAQGIEKAEFRIKEEVEVGTLVGRIPTRPGFTYSLNQDVFEFSLDPASGEIRTRERMDRESLGAEGRFDLVVISSTPTYPIEVVIYVDDVNDNSPAFPSQVAQLTFSEGSTPGSKVILDSAVDPDQGPNARVKSYSIQSGNEEGKFKLSVSSEDSSPVSYLHLETTGPLDRETTATYTLNITATDSGDSPLTGHMLLSIAILDINDNAPVFKEADYSARINESAAAGTFVVQVGAVDGDTGDNAWVSYSLLPSSEFAEQFNIDDETGVLTTSKPLRCPENRCQVSVIARDHGVPTQETQTTVKVVLLDANDHSPQILFRYFPDQTAKFATIEENAKPGTLVTAITVTDQDKGDNGRTSLRIGEGNELGHFKLDSRGDIHIVRVDSVLDRETTREYNLTVIAMDGGNPSRTSTSYLIIQVIDINDHAPVFQQDMYTATLSEAAPVGSFVAAPQAMDEDSGVNSNIYYSIVSGNDLQWFDIHHDSGLITTRTPIDRERLESILLNISARDGGTSPKFAYSSLNITLLDENDEAPAFGGGLDYDDDGGDGAGRRRRRRLELAVSEAAPTGTKLATLTAVDRDRGSNGTVRYRLESATAAASGDDKAKGEKHPSPFAASPFQLHPESGELTVNSQLDRETVAAYELIVTAEDMGLPPLTSTLLVTVKVDDVNDNAPVFYPTHYFVALPKDFPAAEVVVQIQATDRDSGANALLEYDLLATTQEDVRNLFNLDAASGRLFLRQPASQLSSGRVYGLSVTVRDSLGRQAARKAVVEVVLEEGLEVLRCEEELYRFNLEEDSGLEQPKLGRQVGAVSVPESSQLSLEYSIIDGNELDLFVIGESSGAIITARPIDREQANNHLLKIQVRAKERLVSGVCSAEVTILDLNDNRPRVLNSGRLTLLEDAPIRQVVDILSVEDPDAGANAAVEFRLLRASTSSSSSLASSRRQQPADAMFSIHPETGVLHLEQSLVGLGGRQSVSLEILVRDKALQGSLASNFTYHIEVEDVNDHTPLFDLDNYDLSLAEDSPVNAQLFWLRATDGDQGENGDIEYRILEASQGGQGEEEEEVTAARTFGIFPDGHLYLKRALDREVIDYYLLTVSAKDRGSPPRSSTTTLTIHVTDVNDNAPRFEHPSYSFSLNENEAAATYLGKIQAEDADRGRNAELTYAAEKNQKYFSVEPKTGFIFTVASLDREQLIKDLGTDSLTFEVLVSDNGIPRLVDSATVTVAVHDENDNTPTFTTDSYVAKISEAAKVGTEVKTVFAVDNDAGNNGLITYRIVSGDRSGVFGLNATTGFLWLNQSLDREATASYHLILEAGDRPGDGDGLSRTSRSQLEVIVTDENDNPPKILNRDLTLTLAENTTVGQEVFRFAATDRDQGENADIRYAITTGAGAAYSRTFAIDPFSGALVLQGSLDYERDRSLSLTVTAYDLGSPSLSDTATLRIRVTDVNDNPPRFPSTAIVRQLAEGVGRGTTVLTMEAQDVDSGANGKIAYSLAGFETGSAETFAIDPASGIIRTVGDIDRETVDTYRFTVVAMDQAEGMPRLSAEKVITIIIEDTNDNSPEFMSVPTGLLTPSTSPGSKITTVLATDRDSNSNGLVSYRLQQDSFLFSIDHYSGEIKLKNRPERLEARYEVVVVASDEGVASERRSATASLTILGLESRDKGPPCSQDVYTAKLVEEGGEGAYVATVRLADAFGGGDTAAAASYYIGEVKSDSGRNTNLFRIDSRTGDLRTSRSLDREEHGSQFNIQVLVVSAAADAAAPRTPEGRAASAAGSRVSECTVQLAVEDVNDSPPYFEDLSTIRFSENTLPGEVITIIKAGDPDLGGVLEFSLVSGDTDTFQVEGSTGALSLRQPVDREERELYRLTIRLSDTLHTTDITQILLVTDENDNIPTFVEPTFSFEVYESAAKGSQVGKVTALDSDKGPNADIAYDLLTEWGKEVFSLDPATGIFTLTAELDYERTEHYIFVVSATDNGLPTPLSSTVTVYINVRDVNDNVPVFGEAAYAAAVAEDVAVGASILQVGFFSKSGSSFEVAAEL